MYFPGVGGWVLGIDKYNKAHSKSPPVGETFLIWAILQSSSL
jgi:hypothetical protein